MLVTISHSLVLEVVSRERSSHFSLELGLGLGLVLRSKF